MKGDNTFKILVEEAHSGQRLDHVVASCLPDLSRSLVSHLIRSQQILINDEVKKPGYRVRPGDEIRGHIPPPEPLDCKPEPIPLDLLFEDSHLLVINKPAGLVIHPAPGNRTGTLVNALLYHCPDLSGIGNVVRPGIVHRLDKDTSGVLIAAKTASAHQHLSHQFKSRSVKKKYQALVYGRLESDTGIIDDPIGRHPVDRKKMSIHSPKGRKAITHWRVRHRFKDSSLLEVEIKTGRTHQIRVHCAAMGYPVVGDPVYGKKNQIFRLTPSVQEPIPRQMLHSWEIEFEHPVDRERKRFRAPLPRDMAALIEKLKPAGLKDL